MISLSPLCNRRSGMLALLLLSLSWGLTGSIRRLLEAELDPLAQLALQSLGASAVLVLTSQLRGTVAFPTLTLKTFALVNIRVLLGGVVAISMILHAYSHAPIALIAWITALPGSVVWAWILFRQRSSRAELLLLIIGLIGIWHIAETNLSTPTISVVFALFGTLLFTLGLTFSRAMVNEIGSLGTATWTLTLTGVYAGIIALSTGSIVPPLSSAVWYIIGVSSALVAANTVLQIYGFAYVRPAVASSIANLKIIWAPLIAVALFGESPQADSGLGVALLLGSVFLSPWASKNALPKKAPVNDRPIANAPRSDALG